MQFAWQAGEKDRTGRERKGFALLFPSSVGSCKCVFNEAASRGMLDHNAALVGWRTTSRQSGEGEWVLLHCSPSRAAGDHHKQCDDVTRCGLSLVKKKKEPVNTWKEKWRCCVLLGGAGINVKKQLPLLSTHHLLPLSHQHANDQSKSRSTCDGQVCVQDIWLCW